jgi:hypothetical protein
LTRLVNNNATFHTEKSENQPNVKCNYAYIKRIPFDRDFAKRISKITSSSGFVMFGFVVYWLFLDLATTVRYIQTINTCLFINKGLTHVRSVKVSGIAACFKLMPTVCDNCMYHNIWSLRYLAVDIQGSSYW